MALFSPSTESQYLNVFIPMNLFSFPLSTSDTRLKINYFISSLASRSWPIPPKTPFFPNHQSPQTATLLHLSVFCSILPPQSLGQGWNHLVIQVCFLPNLEKLGHPLPLDSHCMRWLLSNLLLNIWLMKLILNSHVLVTCSVVCKWRLANLNTKLW